MRQNGWTAAHVATELGLKPKTVQPWVTTGKSHSEPSPQNLLKLKQFLHPRTQPQTQPELLTDPIPPANKPVDSQARLAPPASITIKKGKIIREPVQMDVELTPLETRIIDTATFQRLRHLKQLGTTNLVFVGATHTRFEHCLGTLEMAQKMLTAISRNHEIPEPAQRLVRLCALLHDVTHIPYGHTLEDEGFLYKRHDDVADKPAEVTKNNTDPPWKNTRWERFLGPSSEIGMILGTQLCNDVLTYLTINGDKVNDLPYPYVVDIVGNTVCADLLDYLARDTYYTGLRETFDPRFLRNLTIATYDAPNGNGKSYRNRVVLSLLKQNRLRRDVVSEVMNLLRLRYSLAEKVYFHHAKVITSAMIIEAVQAALMVKPEEFSQEALCNMSFGDDELLIKLRDSKVPIAEKIVNRLCSRSLYKPVYMLTYNAPSAEDTSWPKKLKIIEKFRNDHKSRFQTERRLESWLSLPQGSVIIYCPTEEMNLKEMEALCLWHDGQVMPLRDIPGEKLAVDAKSIANAHMELWKLYVMLERGLDGELETMHHLASICYNEFGLTNCMEEFATVEAPPLERYIEDWAFKHPELGVTVVEKQQLVTSRNINKNTSLTHPPSPDDLEKYLKDIRG